jgi:glycosyltransferase involved in cell wall biosynthesis
MRRRRVLWVSTSMETKGGVSSYVRTMRQTPLWESWGVHHVATHRDGSVTVRIVTYIRGATMVLWQLVAHRPDVMHLHTASYGSFARKSLLAWLARGWGVPVVIHVHGAEFHTFFMRSPRVLRAYIRATLNHAGKVVALGETWACRLAEIAPRASVVVIPNAVRPELAVEQPEEGELVRVLFLGQVSDRKGAFALIDAWEQLRRIAPPGTCARLVLAGDGAVDRARALVRDLSLSDEVRVLGWVAPQHINDVLRQAHVLALPSRDEGQPMAVLEAMAHGLCVVVSAVGGLPDIVDDSCGVLTPADDVPALAAALHGVIVDPQRRADLGANALQRVRERFDVDVVWKKLDALYEELTR